mgnify:CR=1 FL=1
MMLVALIRNTLLVRRHGAAVIDFLVMARRWMRCNRRLLSRQDIVLRYALTQAHGSHASEPY